MRPFNQLLIATAILKSTVDLFYCFNFNMCSVNEYFFVPNSEHPIITAGNKHRRWWGVQVCTWIQSPLVQQTPHFIALSGFLEYNHPIKSPPHTNTHTTLSSLGAPRPSCWFQFNNLSDHCVMSWKWLAHACPARANHFSSEPIYSHD